MTAAEKKSVRIICLILFVIYVFALLYMLLFAEGYDRLFEYQEYRINTSLGKEILRAWNNRETLGWQYVLLNIGGNLIGFIPMGFFAPMVLRQMRHFFSTSLFCFSFSLVVECIQMFERIGCFDVDDLLLNTIGGILGYLLFAMNRRLQRRKTIDVKGQIIS